MEKLISVKVKTDNGVKEMFFRPAVAPRGEYVCSICPYEKICESLPSPINPNSESNFLEFCGDLSFLCNNSLSDGEPTNPAHKEMLEKVSISNTKSSDIIPIAGTLEEAFGNDFDICQELIKKNRLVRTQDVINSVCAGWCDSFDPSYCNCNRNNSSCILQKLFENTQTDFPEEEVKEDEEIKEPTA